MDIANGGEGYASPPPHAECIDAATRILTDIAQDIIDTAHAIRDEYLLKGETTCPAGCGRIIRVELAVALARIVLTDPHSNRPHWCTFLPLSSNDFDKEYRARAGKSKPIQQRQQLTVEVERLER